MAKQGIKRRSLFLTWKYAETTFMTAAVSLKLLRLLTVGYCQGK